MRGTDTLTAFKLLLIWLLVLTASAAGSQLIARYAYRGHDGDQA